ncbi:HNH endonuclease signature motif containing protein [Corynebacterium marambiense]|uniref:HNH endonuclease signature motif containing protein n=1 Tax=Corynebacterium marambiense TaxID=2765364 RepID=UPI00396AAAD9
MAEGGTDDLDNLQAVCIPCHALKTQSEAQRSRARVSRKRPRAPHPSEGLLRYRTPQR